MIYNFWPNKQKKIQIRFNKKKIEDVEEAVEDEEKVVYC